MLQEVKLTEDEPRLAELQVDMKVHLDTDV